ncbi:hypothetical protein J7T55_011078 [Diaporthe amygdali]|uniref:uncharacterized protein n=1 Tax=Phomopsis amygdali TaxID=1214568 RepID=UPI0022FE1391|nr:uncharacterized protein J7T55_011078 [Diaporthe amygdali]KAJ0106983.1 hypothetical protein J7T55_011078 [Diaporthe amygdali]
MDFINKFKHGEEPEQKHEYTDSAAQTGSTHDLSNTAPQHDAEEPKRDFIGKLIGGSGHHGGKHESGDKDKGFFDKLISKEDREKKNLELEKRELELNYELEKVLKEKKDNETFFDKLKDKFDGDIDKEKVVQHEAKEEDDKPSFFDKLTGKDEREKKAVELDRKEAEIRADLEKVKHDKKENQDLLERIKDKLDGDEDEEQAKPHEKPSFLDKITGKAEEEERRRKEEENKNAFEKMHDRINENLGGGRKAEEKEDFLDKTIDGFQEHVLHKGDQSHESAFEQAKDAQIAHAIRNQLHLKDKDKK